MKKSILLVAAALILSPLSVLGHDVEGDHLHAHLAGAENPPQVGPKGGTVSVQYEGHTVSFTLSDKYHFPDRPDIKKNLRAAHGASKTLPNGDQLFGLSNFPDFIGVRQDGTSYILETDADMKNSHGMGLVQSSDGETLILAADNVRKTLWIVDQSGKKRHGVTAPEGLPFTITDATGANRFAYAVDGYSGGKGNFVHRIDPNTGKHTGNRWGGYGKAPGKFTTDHGIHFDAKSERFFVADRENRRVQVFNSAMEKPFVLDLPTFDKWGARPCDVDVLNTEQGDFMLVGCLDAPGRYVLNPDGSFKTVKQGDRDVRVTKDDYPGACFYIYHLGAETLADTKLVAQIHPKRDFNIATATHIHNAAWWKHDNGDVYVVFYSWNPGDEAGFVKIDVSRNE